jgi:hypothetical protein
VYDNMGLETAWKNFQTVLVSDAGMKMAPDPEPRSDWAQHALRVLDLIDNQVRSLRKRQVIQSFIDGARKGAYWGVRGRAGGGCGLPRRFGRHEHGATLRLRQGSRARRQTSVPESRRHSVAYRRQRRELLRPGSPRDYLLFKSNAFKEGKTYREFARAGSRAGFYAAVEHLDVPEDDLDADAWHIADRGHPFDRIHRIPVDRAKMIDAFRHSYGFTDDANEGPPWRRIDAEWLASAQDLAMALDGDTNNSSLVLAIELVKSRKVLLFAADAQVGNWVSWDGVSFGGQRGLAEDLLGRTVLYKVGHHGSHNATLSEKGLERMNHPRLVALLPVHQKWANDVKRWPIPWSALMTHLRRKTGGRIIRSDSGMPNKPAGAPSEEWDWFQKMVAAPVNPAGQDLYLDITVKDTSD